MPLLDITPAEPNYSDMDQRVRERQVRDRRLPRPKGDEAPRPRVLGLLHTLPKGPLKGEKNPIHQVTVLGQTFPQWMRAPNYNAKDPDTGDVDPNLQGYRLPVVNLTDSQVEAILADAAGEFRPLTWVVFDKTGRMRHGIPEKKKRTLTDILCVGDLLWIRDYEPGRDHFRDLRAGAPMPVEAGDEDKKELGGADQVQDTKLNMFELQANEPQRDGTKDED